MPTSPPELLVQPKRTTNSEDSAPHPPASSTLPKAASSTPSPPSPLSPPSPPSQATPSSEEKRDGDKGARQEGRGGGVGGGDERGGDGGSPELKVEERGSEQRQELKEENEGQSEQEVAAAAEEEVMEVTEEGQTKVDDVMDQSEGPQQNLNTEEPARGSAEEPQQLLDQVPIQALVPISANPVQDVPVQAQGQPDTQRDSQRDPQPAASEDFCENMSTQSDNQSGDFATAD